MTKHCEIVQDLLPQYIDQELSQVSALYVESHLKNCDNCSTVKNTSVKIKILNQNINTQLCGKGKITPQEIEFITKLKKWKRGSALCCIILILLLSFIFPSL